MECKCYLILIFPDFKVANRQNKRLAPNVQGFEESLLVDEQEWAQAKQEFISQLVVHI